MFNPQQNAVRNVSTQSLAMNKVLRNTYIMLS